MILFSSRVEGGPGEQIRSDRCKAGGWDEGAVMNEGSTTTTMMSGPGLGLGLGLGLVGVNRAERGLGMRARLGLGLGRDRLHWLVVNLESQPPSTRRLGC